MLRHCAEWLDHLEHQTFPPAVNLRPEGDHPDRCHVVVNLARVGAILRRIAFDVEELARARRIEEGQACNARGGSARSPLVGGFDVDGDAEGAADGEHSGQQRLVEGRELARWP